MDARKIVVFVTRLFTNPINFLVLKLNGVEYESFPHINGMVKIIKRGKGGRIQFGKNITMNSGSSFNLIGGPYGFSIMIRNGGQLKIGNNVAMSNVAIVCADHITIEDDVLIGGGTKIWDTDFHSLKYEDRVNGDKNIKTAPISIQKGSFIGGNCTLLKGSNVGERSVLATGAILTKQTGSHEIWGGNPAKYIKGVC